MSAEPRIKVLVGHNPAEDFHEWIVHRPYPGRPEPSIARRDSLGRAHPNGWHEWLRFRCNNEDCAAEAIVSCDMLISLLPPAPDTTQGGEG